MVYVTAIQTEDDR